MSISTNDLKNGMALNLPEGLMSVVEFQHVKPGKGGAFVCTKLKNVRSGAVLDRTFRADEKVKLEAVPLPPRDKPGVLAPLSVLSWGGRPATPPRGGDEAPDQPDEPPDSVA